MPVDTKHEEYERNLNQWQRCRAVCGGADLVKSERYREAIFPRLSGHQGAGGNRQYESYVEGAYFFPGAARYREALVGMMFLSDPVIELPPSMVDWSHNVTGADSPVGVEEFIEQHVVPEVATTGRIGILTDWPSTEARSSPRDLTVADVERLGIGPVLTLYRAEDVINWYEDVHLRRRRKRMVVLHEEKRVQVEDDPFVRQTVKQWRVLLLTEPDPSVAARMPAAATDVLAYKVEVWEEGDKKGEFVLVEERWPTMSGELMTSIPFELERGEKPPLLDLVDVNVAHVRNSAMYEHGLLYTGSPQPYVTGYDPDTEGEEDEYGDDPVDAPATRRWSGRDDLDSWNLGASTIWFIRNENARPGVLVTEASGLSALREAMDKKIEEMVIVGGRVLAREKQAAEAARTEEIRREPERGVISKIGKAAQAAVERALMTARDWMEAAGDVSVDLNLDSIEDMTPEEALAWSDLAQRGHLPLVALWDKLRTGGVIPADMTDEQVRAELLRSGPAVPATDVD